MINIAFVLSYARQKKHEWIKAPVFFQYSSDLIKTKFTFFSNKEDTKEIIGT